MFYLNNSLTEIYAVSPTHIALYLSSKELLIITIKLEIKCTTILHHKPTSMLIVQDILFISTELGVDMYDIKAGIWDNTSVNSVVKGVEHIQFLGGNQSGIWFLGRAKDTQIPGIWFLGCAKKTQKVDIFFLKNPAEATYFSYLFTKGHSIQKCMLSLNDGGQDVFVAYRENFIWKKIITWKKMEWGVVQLSVLPDISALTLIRASEL
jgi:hypothetical protein